jgi:hypothetical protein
VATIRGILITRFTAYASNKISADRRCTSAEHDVIKSQSSPTKFIKARSSAARPKRSIRAISAKIRKPSLGLVPQRLFHEVRSLIESARLQVAHAVNKGLVLLYWDIGRRIRRELLQDKRASYGEKILPTLSAKLVPKYGEGFSERNLARMIQFAERFPEPKVVSTLSGQLGSWNHLFRLGGA